MSHQVEYTAVPEPHEDYAQEVLHLIGDPNLAINILEPTPELTSKAKELIQALQDANGVHLMIENGRLWWGPTDKLTLQQIATLIAFRKPVMAALEAGFEPKMPPDVGVLKAMMGNGPGGFPERMLQDLGMRQGKEWAYIMDDSGKMQAGISLDGLLLMVDKCAAEHGWPDEERESLKAEFRASWAREHGGGGHG